jgi:hypothetical protein
MAENNFSPGAAQISGCKESGHVTATFGLSEEIMKCIFSAPRAAAADTPELAGPGISRYSRALEQYGTLPFVPCLGRGRCSALVHAW